MSLVNRHLYNISEIMKTVYRKDSNNKKTFKFDNPFIFIWWENGNKIILALHEKSQKLSETKISRWLSTMQQLSDDLFNI